jgi:elongation factor P hydroxylase
MQHHASDLILLFNQCFEKTHRTRLVLGGDEPLYVPAKNEKSFHQIFFARGYFSSALHEIAHWLIAGKERRKLEDYGYWYIPDGRNAKQQTAFEKVEIKPQAVEWILSDACHYSFQISLDNLNGPPIEIESFRTAILKEKQKILSQPLAKRTEKFIQLLKITFNQKINLNQSRI